MAHCPTVSARPLLVGFALLGTLFTVPLLTAIRNASGPWEAFGLIACAWIIVSGYTLINALVKAELVPGVFIASPVWETNTAFPTQPNAASHREMLPCESAA